MALHEFQKSLVRVLTDRSVRDCLLGVGPSDSVSAEWPAGTISDSDWAQLQTIGRERLLLYARLLLEKRISKIRDVLPWTWGLLKDDLSGLISLYADQHPPISIAKLDEARTFCSFLRAHTSQIQCPYAHAVALYELALAEHIFRERSAESGESESQRRASLDDSALRRMTCISGRHVRVMAFEYDLGSILPALEKGERPAVTPQTTYIVFQSVPGRKAPATFTVSEEMFRLIGLCDGRLSVGNVITALAAHYGCLEEPRLQDFKLKCVTALERLLQTGILDLRAGREEEKVT